MSEERSTEDIISLAVLQLDVIALRKDVSDLTAATTDLVKAWEAAGKTMAFVKFIAGLATALGGAWLALSAMWHPHP